MALRTAAALAAALACSGCSVITAGGDFVGEGGVGTDGGDGGARDAGDLGPHDAGCGLPQPFPTAIVSEVTLDDVFMDPACVDYAAPDRVSVMARLTIPSGVRATFPARAALDVSGPGVLLVHGTAASPVILEGESGGTWDGIAIRTNSIENEIDYARIERGGTAPEMAALFVATRAVIALRHVTVHRSMSDGIATYAPASDTVDHFVGQLSAFEANVLTGNHGAPLRTHPSQLTTLDAATTYDDAADANGDVHVVVAPGGTYAAATIRALSVPYAFVAGPMSQTFYTYAAGTTTIEAGATFDVGANVDIVFYGACTAMGTAAAPIVFRGSNDVAAFWHGLSLGSIVGTADLTLDHVQVRDAGGAVFSPASIYAERSSTLRMTNSEVSRGASYCLRLAAMATATPDPLAPSSMNVLSDCAAGPLAP